MRNGFNRLIYTLKQGLIRRFDELSRFLISLSALPFILAILLQRVADGYISLALFFCAAVLFLWGLWRSASVSRAVRAKENDHFRSSIFYRDLSDAKERFSQRKYYRFFRCPECRKWLRVPRGHGKIEITCPLCKTRFRRKT